jgi:hypothetical protein
MEKEGSGICSLTRSTPRVEGHAGVLGWGLGWLTACQLFTWICANQTTSWLMHNYNTFGAQTSHGHTRTHKIHHGLNLGETTTFPLIVFFVINHGGYIQMLFCSKTFKLGILKFSKLGVLALWRAIISCANLQLRWGLSKVIPSLRAFQLYVAHHLNVNKPGRFLTFNVQKSNW